MKRYIYLLPAALLMLSSCEKIAMRPNPGTSNIEIFDEYVKLVGEKFSMLEYKGVDMDFLYDSLAPLITEDLTDGELFEKLTTITYKLKDAHSDLTMDTVFYYPFFEGAPLAYDEETLELYLADSTDLITYNDGDKDAIRYGNLYLDKDIGYMRIRSWMFFAYKEEMDTIFKKLSEYEALIIDVRDNSGGDPVLATQFAGYLTDQTEYLGTERFKTGPAAGDTVLADMFLEPAESKYRFTGKPVIVLMDVWCFSATTTFLYSLNVLPDVQFIGWRSGGGAGSVAGGFLANGWQWDLSVSEFVDLDGNHWDNGYEPDIVQVLDTTNHNVDEVLERAYLELN